MGRKSKRLVHSGREVGKLFCGGDLVYDNCMEIYVGADHRGLALKNTIKEHVVAAGHTVHDVGATSLQPDDDYPEYAVAVANEVATNPDRRGIVVCGSGIGMAIAANKIPGIRAASVTDERAAKLSRQDDNTNVLSLGADFLDEVAAKAIVTTWLATEFSGEARHQRRLDQIAQLEKE